MKFWTKEVSDNQKDVNDMSFTSIWLWRIRPLFRKEGDSLESKHGLNQDIKRDFLHQKNNITKKKIGGAYSIHNV